MLAFKKNQKRKKNSSGNIFLYIFFLAKKGGCKEQHTQKIYINKRTKYKWRGHKPKAPLSTTKSKIR
jgi:hypothetical protein